VKNKEFLERKISNKKKKLDTTTTSIENLSITIEKSISITLILYPSYNSKRNTGNLTLLFIPYICTTLDIT